METERKITMIRFGPAGNSDSFYNEGYKSSLQAPKWLNEKGLSAFEYQCGNGIVVKEDTAVKLGIEAEKYDIALSVHAPYFISLASPEEEKRKNSIRYIIDSLKVARWMNAKRIVVHPGGASKGDRRELFELACKTMREALNEAQNQGLDDIYICPETMGKINQLGTVDEIIEMCKMDERLIPTLDFGHINARGLGCLKDESDFEEIVLKVKNELGEYRGKHFHSHFSRIEFTKGGEKKHWTFADTEYGPDFTPLANIIKKYSLEPVIICESRGTQVEDAIQMKEECTNE